MTASARRGPGEWLLAAEAFVLLAVFRVGLAVVPVHKLIGAITRRRVGAGAEAAGNASEHDVAIAMRVRWAVEAVARNSPAKFVCFPQTLAAYAMLRRRGVASTMVYGVTRSANGELIAHTWLLVGDRAVVGGEGAGGFVEVERWE
ncbi:MAG: lasso peptide biosynthesis B2 protein [Acidobacteriaceae bacterium]|jgi:hypothetical protein